MASRQDKPVAARHTWEQTARYAHRCTRCGMIRERQALPADLSGLPPAYVNRFERRGLVSIGNTPPCPGTLDAPPAQEAAPAGRPAGPAVTHRGGCAFCRWWAKSCCTHAAYPMPTPYVDAREPGQPCGPRASLWEYPTLDDPQ